MIAEEIAKQIPVESWYKAIQLRRSRRSYIEEELPQKKVERMRSICRDFRPFLEARAELILAPGMDVFRGIVGSYGRIDNAPAYVAFIGDMSSPRVQEAVGYTGEGVILEATAAELGTCWVGGFFRPESVSKRVALSGSERVLAVSPLGIPPKTYSFQEKLMTGFGRMHKRKLLKELVEQLPKKEWQHEALEAARMAPSAVNRQPWRFLLNDYSITIDVDSGRDSYKISRRLDCGIAMLHLELGSRHEGIRGRWSFPSDHLACYLDIGTD